MYYLPLAFAGHSHEPYYTRIYGVPKGRVRMEECEKERKKGERTRKRYSIFILLL